MVDNEIVHIDSSKLRDLVTDLVDLRYEGQWWDFKRQWPDCNSLLHDIICMANNTSFTTALLIIGVDEEEDFTYRTTGNDDRSKNTQMLVDFLKDKPFLGGNRPEVEVRRIEINESTCIDVIIIYSTRQVPYVLFRNWRDLKVGNIYTRINDTNTAVDATADLDKVEKLWRQHFYLDTSAVERMKLYITDHNNWHDGYCDKDSVCWFYIGHPEYILGIIDDDRDGMEYYHIKHCDPTPYWASLYLRYHQTVIKKFDITYLDGGNYFNIAPTRTYIKGCLSSDHLGQSYSYCYFIRGTYEYRLFELFNYLQQNGCYAYEAQKRFIKSIVIYDSYYEKEIIDNKIISHAEAFKRLVDNEMQDIYIGETFSDEQKESFLKSYGTVHAINKWIDKLRNN